jgi:ketosteroid isomerase-like protein
MRAQHTHEVGELVDRVYTALADGDLATLTSMLAPDFRAELTPGLPCGWGAHPYESAHDMIRHGWGRVAAVFDVRADPDVVLLDGEGAAVLGTYRGRARAGGAPLEATFAHLWRVADGRFVSLRQVTDTVAWRRAASVVELEPVTSHDWARRS